MTLKASAREGQTRSHRVSFKTIQARQVLLLFCLVLQLFPHIRHTFAQDCKALRTRIFGSALAKRLPAFLLFPTGSCLWDRFSHPLEHDIEVFSGEKSSRSIMQEKVIEAVDSHLRILGGHWKLGNSRDVERVSGNYAAAFQWIPARGWGEPMFCMTRIRQGVMYNLCWYGNRRTTWTHHRKTPQWLSSMVTMS